MAHYQVYWIKGKQGPPKASHWYTLGSVVVWASPVLTDWVGKRHGDLVAWLYHTPQPVWWVKEDHRVPELLDQHCVPPTQKYHKQLKQCVDALLEGLMEKCATNREPAKPNKTMPPARYNALQHGEASLTPEEIADGWFFDDEYDGLLANRSWEGHGHGDS